MTMQFTYLLFFMIIYRIETFYLASIGENWYKIESIRKQGNLFCAAYCILLTSF